MIYNAQGFQISSKPQIHTQTCIGILFLIWVNKGFSNMKGSNTMFLKWIGQTTPHTPLPSLSRLWSPHVYYLESSKTTPDA